MSSSPARGYLTRWLAQYLTDAGVLCGIGEAPDEGGWNDDPQQDGSWFSQYVVITPMSGSTPEGSIADPGGMWQLPYALVSHGIVPAQVEGQADSVRRIVNEIAKGTSVSLDGVGWRIIDSISNSIGGMDIYRQVEPLEYSQRDVVMVWISKER